MAANYGTLITETSHTDLIIFEGAWYKVVKHTWGLHPGMHSAFLHFLIGHSFCSMLLFRFCSFLKSCFFSDNPQVLFIARITCVFGKNVYTICNVCNNDALVANPHVNLL